MSLRARRRDGPELEEDPLERERRRGRVGEWPLGGDRSETRRRGEEVAGGLREEGTRGTVAPPAPRLEPAATRSLAGETPLRSRWSGFAGGGAPRPLGTLVRTEGDRGAVVSAPRGSAVVAGTPSGGSTPPASTSASSESSDPRQLYSLRVGWRRGSRMGDKAGPRSPIAAGGVAWPVPVSVAVGSPVPTIGPPPSAGAGWDSSASAGGRRVAFPTVGVGMASSVAMLVGMAGPPAPSARGVGGRPASPGCTHDRSVPHTSEVWTAEST